MSDTRFKPGHIRLGGKKKGFKKDRSVEETAERLGCDPFEVLCLFAKGDKKTLGVKQVTASMRLAAAKEACKYLYSQKRAVEITNPDGTGFKIEIVDYSTPK